LYVGVSAIFELERPPCCHAPAVAAAHAVAQHVRARRAQKHAANLQLVCCCWMTIVGLFASTLEDNIAGAL